MPGCDLNLARKPFSNLRPYLRAGLVFATIGLVLLVVNVSLFWRYQAGSVQIRRQLRDVEQSIATELDQIRTLERGLVAADLDTQNEHVEYLNRRIAERTFPWSKLFDRIAEVLPSEVRLYSLSPYKQDEDRRVRQRAEPDVPLVINGSAQSGEALFAFVDALFAHRSFRSPRLDRESPRDGQLEFSLRVNYLPDAVPSDGGSMVTTAVAGEAAEPIPAAARDGEPIDVAEGATEPANGAAPGAAGGTESSRDEVATGASVSSEEVAAEARSKAQLGSPPSAPPSPPSEASSSSPLDERARGGRPSPARGADTSSQTSPSTPALTSGVTGERLEPPGGGTRIDDGRRPRESAAPVPTLPRASTPPRLRGNS